MENEKLDFVKAHPESNVIKKPDLDPMWEEPLLRIDEQGVPAELINPDIWLNNVQAFYQLHERKLLIVIIICSIYFLGVIL